MEILCSMPFIFYSHERVQVFVHMKNVRFVNGEIWYDYDGNHCRMVVPENTIIVDATHGYRIKFAEGMHILFLNLVPVTPEVCAQLSLLGK